MTIPWRLITDNPPLDGTRVLLWIPGYGMAEFGLWDLCKYNSRPPRPFWNYDSQRPSRCRDYPPSHWAPAPEGPEVTA